MRSKEEFQLYGSYRGHLASYEKTPGHNMERILYLGKAIEENKKLRKILPDKFLEDIDLEKVQSLEKKLIHERALIMAEGDKDKVGVIEVQLATLYRVLRTNHESPIQILSSAVLSYMTKEAKERKHY